MYIIISLIFLCAIIVYFIFYCFDFDFECNNRFHKLKSDSCYKSLLSNYSNIKKCTPDKVVVSFTTIPSRVSKMKPMLNSLLDQTVRIDQIALNIPEDVDYDIPKQCEETCNIYRTGKDYGIGTKFVPTILRESDSGTKIILVKDNVVYGKDFIEKMLTESDKHPEKCLYIGDKFEGSDGILIKPDFFKDVTRNECNDKWLEENIKADKKSISYSKNRKLNNNK